MRIRGALALLAVCSTALAEKEPPLPDLGTARCYEDALMIDVARRHPYSTPREFVGTPWEPTLKAKDEIERAERRREFLRDCARIGFRLADTAADEAHNKQLAERQSRDFEAKYDAAAMWHYQRRDRNAPSPFAQGIPPIEPSAEQVAMKECADRWIYQVSLPRYLRDQVEPPDQLTPGASLARRCGKYGFEDARDAQADAGNRRAWERLHDRIAELRRRDSQRMMRKLVGAP